jgi:predicted permease
VIAFTLLMVLVAATVPVLAPAWQVFRTNPIGWLKAGTSGSGTSHRGRRAWLSFQVAGSTVFLTLALMFVTSYVATVQTNPGFNTTHVAALQVTPTSFSITPERQRALMTEMVTRLEAASTIAAVGVTERLAFQVGIPLRSNLSTDGRDCATGGCVNVASSGITPGFFDAMEIRLVAGRVFDPNNAADQNSAVLSSSAAEALWPGRSPLGQWVYEEAGTAPRQVVGVVAAIATARLDRPNEPALYRPLTDDKLSGPLTIVARSRTDADAAAVVLRGLWRDLDPTLPPATIQTMDERLALPRWPSRVGAAFFATCGILAVVLVTIGLFGVTYYAVTQRTKEFGVRLALGATAQDLRRLVLGESMRLIVPGLTVGLFLSAVLASLAQSSLLGVTALDLRWYAVAVALQFIVALIASWSPARRASRVAPQTTLRGD